MISFFKFSQSLTLIFSLLCFSCRLFCDPGFDDIAIGTEAGIETEIPDDEPGSSEHKADRRRISLDKQPFELDSGLFDFLTKESKGLDSEDITHLPRPMNFGTGGIVEKTEQWRMLMNRYSKLPSMIASAALIVNQILDPQKFLQRSKDLGFTLSSKTLSLSPVYLSVQIQSHAMIHALIEKFKDLKSSIEATPSSASTLIEDVSQEVSLALDEVHRILPTLVEKLQDEIQSMQVSLKSGLDKNLLTQLNFDQDDAQFKLKDWQKNPSHPLNPVNWSFDKDSVLVGQEILLNSKIAYTRVHLSSLKKARLNSSDQKALGDYLKKAVVSKSSDGKKDKVLKNPPEGTVLVVHSIVKDATGKPIGVAVIRRKTNGPHQARTIAVIPYPGSEDALLFRPKLPKDLPQISVGIAREGKGAKKIPGFQFLVLLLEEIREQVEGLSKSDLEAAKALKKNSHVFYQYCHADRNVLLSYEQVRLESLLQRIIEIQSLLSRFIDQVLDGQYSKDWMNTAFEVGSSQNALAICASMIAEKYVFDEQAKNQVIGNFAIDARTARIGNFFSRGTNGKQAVLGANSVMSGQHSVIEMQARSWMDTVTVDVYFEGLNPSNEALGEFTLGPNTEKNQNISDYHVYILDPEATAYASLLSCVSELISFTHKNRTGYYKKPIGLCIQGHEDVFLKDENGEVVHGTVDGINGQTKGMINDLSFFKPSHGRFVIYQEAAGLSWAQDWVDYDEATMTAGMRIREVATVARENFRIILDGSGTMKGVFEKVVEALEAEFKALNDASLTSIPTVHIFGAKDIDEYNSVFKPLKAKHGQNMAKFDSNKLLRQEFTQFARGPLSLEELKSERAFGPSPIVAGLKSLLQAKAGRGGIPNKPWILAIISDFQDSDPCFAIQNWVSYFRKFPLDGKRVEALMTRKNGALSINNIAGGVWENLQEIQLISTNGIIEKKISAAKWITKDPLARKGDNGIYFFRKAKNGNFNQALSKFMQPIRESVKQRAN